LRCLFVVSLHRGIQLKPESFADVSESDILGSMLRVMHKVGLRGKMIRRQKWKHLAALNYAYPVMAMLKSEHWVVVLNTADGPEGPAAAVLDPLSEQNGVTMVPMQQFAERWNGTLILCKRVHRLSDEGQPFGIRWFVPELLRHKRFFRDVAVAATMSNVIAFGTPLMFQILIDKVITHHSYQTLLAVNADFRHPHHLRQPVQLHAPVPDDLHHQQDRRAPGVAHLPASAQPADDVLRGHHGGHPDPPHAADRYHPAVPDRAAVPDHAGCDGFAVHAGHASALQPDADDPGVRLLGRDRRHHRHHAADLPAPPRAALQAEGGRQAHLVETIHGMRTVKSIALEQVRMSAWDEKVAQGVTRRATVGRISVLASVLVHGLEKLMQIAVLGLGAMEVFDGNLSVGALVAFNMISGRVTGPLVQIVGLINEYQETAMAVRMLGIIMTHDSERNPNQAGLQPVVTGQLDFDQVTFRYQGSATPALNGVSFQVKPGQVIGIVGRSGSGKTTITRLIQGIQMAQEGTVRVDGVDIRHINLGHLRRSIGVVLQENFLFRGTIRENIAAARPDASLAEVIEASRMAGAEEFIDRLPRSYETLVEENGANFSGGQRQRIAIARALLVQPRLLIFDEATSALDPESEAIVQDHLAEIANGRTLIIVSHRLSSLAHADAILVLEQGKVLDCAPHAELLIAAIPTGACGASRTGSRSHERKACICRESCAGRTALAPLLRGSPALRTAAWTRQDFLPPQPELEDVLSEPPPNLLRGVHYVVAALLVSLLVIASLVKVDMIIAASGRLVADSPTIVVQRCRSPSSARCW